MSLPFSMMLQTFLRYLCVSFRILRFLKFYIFIKQILCEHLHSLMANKLFLTVSCPSGIIAAADSGCLDVTGHFSMPGLSFKNKVGKRFCSLLLEPETGMGSSQCLQALSTPFLLSWCRALNCLQILLVSLAISPSSNLKYNLLLTTLFSDATTRLSISDFYCNSARMSQAQAVLKLLTPD